MTGGSESIRVSKFIRAPREKVFDAWVNPDIADKWLCPEECTILSNSAEVRVGGAYRSSMKCGEDTYTVYGSYREIVTPEKLVFTHQWEQPNSHETRVTVSFKENNGGTEIALTQEGFADPKTARGHEQGWTSALRNLTKHFA